MPGCPVGCCASVRRLTRKSWPHSPVNWVSIRRRSLPICMAVTPPAVSISSNSSATSASVRFPPRSTASWPGGCCRSPSAPTSGPVLVGALVDEMRERKVLAPALSTIERLAWETRRRAERLVFVRLTAALTDVQRAQLDGLLVMKPGARMTALAMLRQPPRRPTPATFIALAERLQTIRAIGLKPDVARQVHQTRLVRLAREGARYSPQFLQRLGPERRYATLGLSARDECEPHRRSDRAPRPPDRPVPQPDQAD